MNEVEEHINKDKASLLAMKEKILNEIREKEKIVSIHDGGKRINYAV